MHTKVSNFSIFVMEYLDEKIMKNHEIFYLQFFSWFEPIWATDKQAKVFSNSVSISLR